jgi:hypothetical protein
MNIENIFLIKKDEYENVYGIDYNKSGDKYDYEAQIRDGKNKP